LSIFAQILNKKLRNLNYKRDMLKDNINTKLYYSISEISEMFGVTNSLIRFWESEFDILSPGKNSKGERRYTQRDIQDFRIVYHLVKERGFTLEGAKNEIAANKKRLKKKFQIMENLNKIKTFLQKEYDKFD